MKKLFMAVCMAICLSPAMAIAAEIPLISQTADTSPTGDDLVYTVNDPAGAPGDRKVTLGDVLGLAESTVLTITENWVNTANPWAVNEGGTGASTAAGARTALGLVIDTDVQAYNANTTALGSTIGAAEVDADVATQAELDAATALNLPLSGGTLTGELVADNLGLEFTAGDDHSDCSAFSATGGGIFFDDSEGILKKCQDNVLTDLDTNSGGATAWDDMGNPDAADEIDFGVHIIELNVADFRIGDGGSNYLRFYDNAGTIRLEPVGSAVLYGFANISASTAISPDAADSATLGTTALEWSDLYIADGGIIYGQDDQGNTLASSATGWIANLDFTIAGDDLFMATNTDGMILVADGTNYNPVQISGDVEISNTGATTIQANAVDSSMINTIVDSVFWDAGGMTPDGTQCADAARVTINSGPAQYTVICADNDGSTLFGHVVMPDSWDGSTVTLELEYLQTAADTSALNADVAMMCRGAGETVNNTWGTEVAIDDAAVTGSNGVDHTTSAAVTPNGTCAGGDTLYWRVQLDATGTTTAAATLHILGAKMEFTSNVGD